MGVPDLDFEIFGVKVKITEKIPQKLGLKRGSPNFETKVGP